jgi:hypothetical protein
MGTTKSFLTIEVDGVVNVGRDFETHVNSSSTSVPGDGLEATVTINGGDLNVSGYMALGAYARGSHQTQFTLNGGTVDVGTSPETADDLILGWYDTDGNVTMDLDDGVMTIAGAIYMGRDTDADGVTPITKTGSGLGTLAINIDGATLQAEDYSVETTASHLITLTDGFFKLNSSAYNPTQMEALIGSDISCPLGYMIYTEGDYTVLTVPEPTAITMVLLSLAGLALMRRKKSV